MATAFMPRAFAHSLAIAVAWGGIHPDERLLAEEPDAFVRSPEELLRVL